MIFIKQFIYILPKSDRKVTLFSRNTQYVSLSVIITMPLNAPCPSIHFINLEQDGLEARSSDCC